MCNIYAASGPILSFVVESGSDTSVLISWKPPDMPNGEITGYIVTTIDLKDSRKKSNTIGDQTIFTETGLGMPFCKAFF